MNLASRSPVFTYLFCFGALLSTFGSAHAREQLFAPGDAIVVVHETAAKVGSETRAVLQPGAEFTVGKVNGKWVSVSGHQNGRSFFGWIHSRDVAKRPPGLAFSWAAKKQATPNQGWHWQLTQGVPQVIHFTSDTAVDVFVVSEEGLASYQWAIKQNAGQMSSRLAQRNVTRFRERWAPPDSQKYYLVVDNTDFPDRGARGNYSSNFQFVIWRDDPRPEEPIAGRGLIIGQVTLVFDGFEGRHHRFAQPMTVHIAQAASQDDETKHRVLKVTTDQAGYFALANLPPHQRYWVEAVEGPDFTAPVTMRVSRPIRGPDDDAADQQQVLDLGYFALTVAANGAIGAQLDSPSLVVTKKAGEEGSQVRFSSTGSLDRHDWFQRTYPFSGWASMVRQDQARIERERQNRNS